MNPDDALTDIPDGSSISPELVQEFISEAVATNPIEEEILALANVALHVSLNPSRGYYATGRLRSFFNTLHAWRHGTIDPGGEADEVAQLQVLILNEIHEALCKKTAKYRQVVNELAHNGQLLIVAIAGYVAGAVHLAVGVVTARLALSSDSLLL